MKDDGKRFINGEWVQKKCPQCLKDMPGPDDCGCGDPSQDKRIDELLEALGQERALADSLYEFVNAMHRPHPGSSDGCVSCEALTRWREARK